MQLVNKERESAISTVCQMSPSTLDFCHIIVLDEWNELSQITVLSNKAQNYLNLENKAKTMVIFTIAKIKHKPQSLQ